MCMKRILPAALCFLLLISAGLFLSAQEEHNFQIVVHRSNKATVLPKNDVAKIFLKKQRTWEDGSQILPVDLEESSRTRDDFSKVILRKKVSSVKAYWQKQIFTGRGVPPPEKLSDEAVLKYIEDHPEAIGYVSPSTSLKGRPVKAVEVSDEK